MPANSASADPQGQPQTVSTPETVHPNSGIGSQNVVGLKQTKVEDPTIKKADPEIVTQPQNKDERHASRKITELSESRIEYARLAIDADKDAIYKIAEKEPDLAEKLLKEFDYGTESIAELLALKDAPKGKEDEVIKDVQTQSKIQELEARVLDETIKRLKKDHPDLKDELEQELRSMYSNSTFDKYDEDQKVNIARAATGKPSQHQDSTVILDMLKQQEGTISAPKGADAPVKTNRIPADKQRMYKAAGVTEADLENLLPADIDSVIEKAFYVAGKYQD